MKERERQRLRAETDPATTQQNPSAAPSALTDLL